MVRKFIMKWSVLANLLFSFAMLNLAVENVQREVSYRRGLFSFKVKGKTIRDDMAIRVHVLSAGQCTQKCISDAKCRSYAFNSNEKGTNVNCKLSQKIASEDDILVDHSDWDYCDAEYQGVCEENNINCNPLLRYCELYEYGYCERVKIVSRKKKTAQSSTLSFLDSSKAVDGISKPFGGNGFCIHTQENKNPWWRVDLESTFYVASVIITNRDNSYYRFTKGEIRVGYKLMTNGLENTLCTKAGISLGRFETRQFFCSKYQSIFGRYVNVILRKTVALTICEVEVMGVDLKFKNKQ